MYRYIHFMSFFHPLSLKGLSQLHGFPVNNLGSMMLGRKIWRFKDREKR